MNKKQRPAVVGLGMIGGGIAISLKNSGYVSVAYDINPKAFEQVGDAVIKKETLKEVAENSDIVFVCVVNEQQANGVILGEGGLLNYAKKGYVICLVSTVAVSAIKRFSLECEKRGVELFDCGVTPGNLAAQNGMVAMIGGKEQTVNAFLPVIEGWAKKAVYCGPAGSGMAMKLARNSITFGSWRIVKEAQKLIESVGGLSEKLIEVIETADPDGKTLLSKIKQNDENGKLPEYVAQRNLPLMKKDLQAACELAGEYGVDTPSIFTALSYAEDTLDIEEEVDDNRQNGIKMADKVYGQGFGVRLASRDDNLYVNATVENVFGQIWARPYLSMRDRRLLVIGISAALGREDLVKTQALGALRNHELTPTQLNEAVLQLSYYAGWCNGGAVAKAVDEAIAKFRSENE